MDSEITTAGANMCRRRWQAPACGERADLPVLAGSRANAAISLYELERLPGTKELEQVVREADHSPLGPDLGHAAKRKAPKAAPLFDLAEDGFRQGFPARVDRPASQAVELRSHGLGHWMGPRSRRGRAAMRAAIGRDIAVDPGEVRCCHVGLAEKSRVRRHGHGQPPRVRCDLFQQRHELLHVDRLLRHAARRSEEHTSELQSLAYLVCRLLLEKKKEADLARTASGRPRVP